MMQFSCWSYSSNKGMKSYLKILKCIASVSIVDNFIKKPTKKGNIFFNSTCIGAPTPENPPPLKKLHKLTMSTCILLLLNNSSL